MYGGRLVGGGASGELTAAQKAYVQDLDAVYVLSLPAFRWFRADYPARNPRFLHTWVSATHLDMVRTDARLKLDVR